MTQRDEEVLASVLQDHETSGIHGPLHCSLACGAVVLAALASEGASVTFDGTVGAVSALRHGIEAELALLPDGEPRLRFDAGAKAAYLWCLGLLTDLDAAASERERIAAEAVREERWFRRDVLLALEPQRGQPGESGSTSAGGSASGDPEP